MKEFCTTARRLVWLILFVWVGTWVSAQSYDPNKKYKIRELREDFELLRAALEKAHPATYWYTPKDSFSRYFAQAYTAIDHEMTEREFYRLILPLLVRVHCGHTYPDMSKAYYSADLPKKTYLPFDLFLDGDRLFIVTNRSTDSTLAQGDEILKIGGVPVSEIAQLARTLLTADGNNEAWKDKFMALYYFEEVYLEYFDGKPPFRLVVSGTNGVVRETEVMSPPKMPHPVKPRKPLTKKQRERQLRERAEAERAALCRFRFTAPDSDAAILSVAGFGYERVYGVSYLKKHRSIFKALAEHPVKNLVIDLRGNTGGNVAIAEDLMSYLVDKPFKVVDHNELYTENLSYFDELLPHFEKQPKSRSFEAKRLHKTQNPNTYTFRFDKKDLLPPARNHRFSGNVYVITDGWVFSAGSLFVSSLRTQRSITVVGEETGGAAVGCSGGRISRLVLPNTGIRVFFPHFRIYAVTEAKPDGHGVIPDYPVKRTLGDMAQGKDPEMEKTFRLILR